MTWVADTRTSNALEQLEEKMDFEFPGNTMAIALGDVSEIRGVPILINKA